MKDWIEAKRPILDNAIKQHEAGIWAAQGYKMALDDFKAELEMREKPAKPKKAKPDASR